jgi:hypothetical protein
MRTCLAVALLALGLAGAPPARGEPAPMPDRVDLEAIVPHARAVVAAVVEAGRRNARLPARGTPGAEAPFRRTGDDLTTYYIREAATATRRLPAEHAAAAFLLGIGIALDDSDLLRNQVLTGLL